MDAYTALNIVCVLGGGIVLCVSVGMLLARLLGKFAWVAGYPLALASTIVWSIVSERSRGVVAIAPEAFYSMISILAFVAVEISLPLYVGIYLGASHRKSKAMPWVALGLMLGSIAALVWFSHYQDASILEGIRRLRNPSK